MTSRILSAVARSYFSRHPFLAPVSIEGDRVRFASEEEAREAEEGWPRGWLVAARVEGGVYLKLCWSVTARSLLNPLIKRKGP